MSTLKCDTHPKTLWLETSPKVLFPSIPPQTQTLGSPFAVKSKSWKSPAPLELNTNERTTISWNSLSHPVHSPAPEYGNIKWSISVTKHKVFWLVWCSFTCHRMLSNKKKNKKINIYFYFPLAFCLYSTSSAASASLAPFLMHWGMGRQVTRARIWKTIFSSTCSRNFEALMTTLGATKQTCSLLC